MRIALYKDIEHGYQNVHEVTDYMDKLSDYIRLTEIIEVDFKLLPYGEAEKKEIAIIDQAINKVQADSAIKINALNQRNLNF